MVRLTVCFAALTSWGGPRTRVVYTGQSRVQEPRGIAVTTVTNDIRRRISAVTAYQAVDRFLDRYIFGDHSVQVID